MPVSELTFPPPSKDFLSLLEGRRKHWSSLEFSLGLRSVPRVWRTITVCLSEETSRENVNGNHLITVINANRLSTTQNAVLWGWQDCSETIMPVNVKWRLFNSIQPSSKETRDKLEQVQRKANKMVKSLRSKFFEY